VIGTKPLPPATPVRVHDVAMGSDITVILVLAVFALLFLGTAYATRARWWQRRRP